MNLTHEDIAFLADLRNELLTQPTDGNRDPRFWTVNQKYVIEDVQPDSADGWKVLDTYNEHCLVGKPNDLASVIAELCDKENGYGEGFKYPEVLTECLDVEDLVYTANKLLDDDQFMVAYYRERFAPCPDTLFLTKRACHEHIHRYGHNCNMPHTYVMTAERSPEYARLLEILKRVDWAAINVEPERRGQWIEYDVREYADGICIPEYKCSLCGRIEVVEEPYCNCGAKMDGGAE